MIECDPGGGRGKPSRYVINAANIAGFREPKTVQPIAVKPCNPVQTNPAMECKSPKPPNRSNRHLTVIEPPTQKNCGDVNKAAESVCTACSFAGDDMRKLIGDAMGPPMKREDSLDAWQCAGLMIAAWFAYLEVVKRGVLRFRWGPDKFFAQGHWSEPNAWPYDQQRLREQNTAALGARREISSEDESAQVAEIRRRQHAGEPVGNMWVEYADRWEKENTAPHPNRGEPK